MEKNKNFNTILTDVYFPFPFEKKDVLKKAILPSLLVYTNEKYPNEEAFRKEISKHGIFSLRASFTEIGKQNFLVFTLIISDKKTIKEDIITFQKRLKKILIFFLEGEANE